MAEKIPNKVLSKIKDSFIGFCSFIKRKMPAKAQPYMTKKNVVITIIVLFFLAQYVQVASMTGGLSSLNLRGSSLVDEVGRLNEMTNMLSSDLNEVRGYLLMPTRQYSSGDMEDAATDENSDAVEVALFKYIDSLAASEKLKASLENNTSCINSLYNDKGFLDYIASLGLKLSPIEDTSSVLNAKILKDSSTVVSFVMDKETSKLSRKIINASEDLSCNASTFAKDTKDYLATSLKDILATITAIEEKKSYIQSSLTEQKTVDVLTEKKLTSSFDGTNFVIQNEAKETIAKIVLDRNDLSIYLIDERDEDGLKLKVTDLETSLPPFIQKLDILPSAKKMVVEAQNKLSSIFDDGGFKSLLKSSGLKVVTTPRQDDHRYYYDILKDNVLLGSIVIEKANGVIEVVDSKGANTTNLLFFDAGLKKKL